MKNGLVDRLREEVGTQPVNYRAEMMRDAANEIERLRLALYQVKEGGHWRDIPTAALAANI